MGDDLRKHDDPDDAPDHNCPDEKDSFRTAMERSWESEDDDDIYDDDDFLELEYTPSALQPPPPPPHAPIPTVEVNGPPQDPPKAPVVLAAPDETEAPEWGTIMVGMEAKEASLETRESVPETRESAPETRESEMRNSNLESQEVASAAAAAAVRPAARETKEATTLEAAAAAVEMAGTEEESVETSAWTKAQSEAISPTPQEACLETTLGRVQSAPSSSDASAMKILEAAMMILESEDIFKEPTSFDPIRAMGSPGSQTSVVRRAESPGSQASVVRGTESPDSQASVVQATKSPGSQALARQASETPDSRALMLQAVSEALAPEQAPSAATSTAVVAVRPRARSISERSVVAASFVSPEDEALSLRVRSLYDSGPCALGSDASSQFSSDRRISSIIEEGAAAGVSLARGTRSSFPGASVANARRGRLSRSVEGGKTWP